ncbi:MAG: cupin domain-containing protein [Nitrospinae bacterium]|nr:cupin domain-containing protein [Nitrospinota bacterium]
MFTSDKNIVLSPGEGQTIPVPGHKITHKVVGADTDGAYSLLEVELVGDGPPQHIHKTEDEAFYVLEGEINVLLGERTFKATAGSFVLIPRGTVHAFSRIGQEPAKLLAIFSPAGFEQFFDEAVDLDVTDTEAYVAKAKALAEKYNMDIVGPPLEL